MNNLTDAIADLEALAAAYRARRKANGPGHPDNDYLTLQVQCFSDAAWALKQACAAAHEQAARHAAPMFEVVGELTVTA